MNADALALVDAIDDLVHEARPVPLSDQVRVDRAELDALVERLREAVATPDRPDRPAMHELEASGARALYAQGESACVAHLVRLSRAAYATTPTPPVDPTPAPAGVDRLAAMVREAKAVPLTGDVRLVREDVYAVLDALRATLPAQAREPLPPPLDETAARVLYHQGEAAVVEALVRFSRATASSAG